MLFPRFLIIMNCLLSNYNGIIAADIKDNAYVSTVIFVLSVGTETHGTEFLLARKSAIT